MEYLIKFGLNGGFGGASQAKVIDCENIEQAESEAREEACQYYEGYEGSSGLRTSDEIMEEDDLDEESAEEQYREEREGWLEYSAELYDEEKHKDLL